MGWGTADKCVCKDNKILNTPLNIHIYVYIYYVYSRKTFRRLQICKFMPRDHVSTVYGPYSLTCTVIQDVINLSLYHFWGLQKNIVYIIQKLFLHDKITYNIILYLMGFKKYITEIRYVISNNLLVICCPYWTFLHWTFEHFLGVSCSFLSLLRIAIIYDSNSIY